MQDQRNNRQQTNRFSKQKSKSDIKISQSTLTIQQKMMQKIPGLSSMKSEKSSYIRQRYSLPNLIPDSEYPVVKPSVPTIAQQYQFPLINNRSNSDQPKLNVHLVKLKPRIAHQSHLIITPPSVPLARPVDQSQRVHKIEMNVVLNDEIRRTIRGASPSMLYTFKKKEYIDQSKDNHRKRLLKQLEKQVIFPYIERESPSKLKDSIKRGLKQFEASFKSRKPRPLRVSRRQLQQKDQLRGWAEDDIFDSHQNNLFL